jgi:hypothetical protein
LVNNPKDSIGELIAFGSWNYFLSYFFDTRAPGGYYQIDGRTDGFNAIVLGSYTNILPVLARICLGGKVFSLNEFSM